MVLPVLKRDLFAVRNRGYAYIGLMPPSHGDVLNAWIAPLELTTTALHSSLRLAWRH